MKLTVFTNLTKNRGDRLTDTKVIKIKVDRDNFEYSDILKKFPDDTAVEIHEDYAWVFWTVEKDDILNLIKESLGDNGPFSGEIEEEEINLISDEYWKPIGRTIIKRAFISECYRKGPYFKNEDGGFCHPKKISEKKDKKLLCALDIKVYRNLKKNNFYISLDVESRIQKKEDNTPVSSQKARKLFHKERIPDSQERYNRLKKFLEPVKDNNDKIKFNLNNKEIEFSGFIRLPEQVNEHG